MNIRMADSSGNLDRVLTRSNNDVYVGDLDANGGILYMRSNGATGMTLNSGNVGIGTTGPT